MLSDEEFNSFISNQQAKWWDRIKAAEHNMTGDDPLAAVRRHESDKMIREAEREILAIERDRTHLREVRALEAISSHLGSLVRMELQRGPRRG